MPLKPGDKAPAFKLLDQDGNVVELAEMKGTKVLVYFYPGAVDAWCQLARRPFPGRHVASGADVGDRLATEPGGLGKCPEGCSLPLRDPDDTVSVGDLLCGTVGKQRSSCDGGADRVVA